MLWALPKQEPLLTTPVAMDKSSDKTVLYSAANDPETANDPRPEMIPKLDRK